MQARATLFVVSTPIGNLGDLTLRAMEVMRQVAAVAAEDTRRARALLSHLGVSGPKLLRLDAHAPEVNLRRVLELLESGKSVALLTDAGTPSISDPGAPLVRRVRERGLPVTVIPGPSALTASVALSGLVAGPFWFLGFLPRKGPRRRALLGRIQATREAVVLFESPSRTRLTLGELASLMPERTACVCRELTKVYEESVCGPLGELAARAEWRGEVTIVLGPGREESSQASTDPGDLDGQIAERLAAGDSVKDIARDLAAQTGLARRELYQRARALRGARGLREGPVVRGSGRV
jgi:16S rRNA (cytidine1402-2'-O)-methyltransferase